MERSRATVVREKKRGQKHCSKPTKLPLPILAQLVYLSLTFFAQNDKTTNEEWAAESDSATLHCAHCVFTVCFKIHIFVY